MLGKETINILGDSVEATLKNLIASAALLDLRTGRPEEFEKSLIKEVKFLALYEREELGRVEQYIHAHSSDLYQYALRHIRR